MSDRNRLIELFNEIEKDPAITCPHYKTDKACDECKYTINNVMCNHTLRTVDYLLANGVIAPPCKVGDTVYVISRYYTGFFEIYECEIVEMTFFKNNTFIRCEKGRKFSFGVNISEISKTVFLTKEEAEEKLKELNDNG